MNQLAHLARQIARIIPLLLLAPLALASLVFFAVRSAHLLEYPFPLDYGEGPLLSQILVLLGGTPIWGLYADPAAAPFLVVNYPPVYHCVAWLVALVAVPVVGEPARGALLAGRLISLISGLLAAAAIALLVRSSTAMQEDGRTRWEAFGSRLSALALLLVSMAFLGIPIAREWSSVMRVDMLGVCLGLWGLLLVASQDQAKHPSLFWAALLLALSLLTKPSLLAAPAAATIWLFFRSPRAALTLLAVMAAIGLAGIGLLQLLSGGWFWLHVVSANANPWDPELARIFWRDQLVILGPLLLAGGLGVTFVWGLGRLAEPQETYKRITRNTQHAHLFLPLYYSLFGLLTALGVGKYGAYTNYFLEAYAGLFWLAGTCLFQVAQARQQPFLFLSPRHLVSNALVRRLMSIAVAIAPIGIAGLVALSLVRYYPLWSEEYLLPAGIIEGRNPARISFGGYGVWQDLMREEQILAARGRINQALLGPVRAAGAPILTDVPGVAAQAEAQSRLQMFEHRMLIDPGLMDQGPLLRDLANGQVPLIVLDYLGNWLTPEQIALITHRYAQDVSVGTYSIYRPVAIGTRTEVALSFPDGLQLNGLALAPPGDAGTYTPGETALITLSWSSAATPSSFNMPIEVVLGLADREGRPLIETSRPLLYGALPPSKWGGATVQHLQPLAIPYEILPGSYQLLLTLQANGAALGQTQLLTTIEVGGAGQARAGQILGEQGFFVPAPLLMEWERLGGYAGPGDPVTPAVPFVGYTQQCYKTACLRLRDGTVERLPVGQLTWMADAGLPRIPGAPPDGALSEPFQQLYDELGGEAALGPVLGGEMKRFGDIVQYTRYARLERPLGDGPARLGNVGEDVLRLPGGTPYRWP